VLRAFGTISAAVIAGEYALGRIVTDRPIRFLIMLTAAVAVAAVIWTSRPK
jgi:hypothetical protein